MKRDDLTVRFWGVRGSIPCAGPDHAGFGGHTSCVEVRWAGHVAVFDAGSGIVPLGERLAGEHGIRIDLLFSHCHYDHVCGLPFFAPLYQHDREVNLWSGHLAGTMSTREMIADLMRPPFFPVGPEVFRANVGYEDFTPGERLALPAGMRVFTLPLNHPGGAVGYRLEAGGRSVCYITDTEHPAHGHDGTLLEFIGKADLVIYDGTYTEQEYQARKGFGHSTWQEGAALCAKADVGTCAVFHHCPSHDDATLAAIARQAEQGGIETIIAREGMELSFNARTGAAVAQDPAP